MINYFCSYKNQRVIKEIQCGLTIIVIEKWEEICIVLQSLVYGSKIWTTIKCYNQQQLLSFKRMHLSIHSLCVTQQVVNAGQQLLKVFVINKWFSFFHFSLSECVCICVYYCPPKGLDKPVLVYLYFLLLVLSYKHILTSENGNKVLIFFTAVVNTNANKFVLKKQEYSPFLF